MDIFPSPWPNKKRKPIISICTRPSWILILLVIQCFYLPSPDANENKPLSESSNDAAVARIVNPFNATCHDWSGKIIPCRFKRPYAELLRHKPAGDNRFTDNKDGTVTDTLTNLIWLKNTNCFGMMDLKAAELAVKRLKDGDCGPNPAHILSDGSVAGQWRLPTMNELCTLIDFGKRDPALSNGHKFSNIPKGYHWSATSLDDHPQIAWIVYIESGTTCYDDVNSHAGHIWPVRKQK